ncbi:amidohydrolase family protein [Pelagibacterium lentulum]|uniref:Amidohydrolase n=1 Tax=Pelagibacterium lentulum TaxID=2029865 RepID=A0A916REF2_9HYPH|nr:amidohydrolase [Pelagibacterium lentulum]GGA49776.1 amidohydrolase [Pelagibacterium lentulum]
MRILDTHLHLIYRDRISYPWVKGAGGLDNDFTLESYLAEARGLDIESALHMEVDVAESDIEAETAFVTGIDPFVVGAISSARPENKDFPAQLERLMEIGNVKGIRRVLHVVPDEVSQTRLFVENLTHLKRHDLSFDLCLLARQLPLGMALADAHPDTQFILDHCGVPDVEAQALDPWRAYITDMARRPNVAAKISGVIAYAGKDWSVETLRPFVEHVIEAFGWDRVVWGSDHPVCTTTASLTDWVTATRQLIAGASEDEQAKLLHRNAERIYRINP